MNKQTQPKFKGFSLPTTTPIPDEIFDELMAELSGAEVKVLLYICRRTFGFKKDSDTISLNQMIHGIQRKDNTWLDKGTGLSRDSVTRALKTLEERGVIITVKKQSETKGNEVNTYKLNIRASETDDEPSSENRTRGGVKIGLGVVRKSDSQQTVLQQTVRQHRYNNVRKNPVINEDTDQVEYYAQLLADKLDDKKSLSYYRIVCARYNPDKLLKKAAEIVGDGGARKPGAVFVNWLQILEQ